MKRSTLIKTLLFASYFIFLVVSWLTGFNAGWEIGHNLISFTVDSLKYCPAPSF